MRKLTATDRQLHFIKISTKYSMIKRLQLYFRITLQRSFTYKNKYWITPSHLDLVPVGIMPGGLSVKYCF